MKYSKLIIILIFLSSYAIAQESYDKKMSIQELKEDFEIFKNSLIAIHPNLYLYSSKSRLDSLLKHTEMELNDSISSVELCRRFTPIIHSIRNSHTIIKPPQAFLDYINSDAKRLPMSFLYRNDSLIIVENYSTNKKIRTGNVVTKINNIPIKNLIDSLAQFTFVDGYNKSYSDYISSQFLSKRYAYFLGLPPYFEIDFWDSKGNLKKEKIESLPVKEFYTKKTIKSKEDKYSFSIADDIAFLAIKDFIIGDVKKFNRFLKKHFEEINEERINHLIVDLRNNPGGNPEATNKLLGFFIKEEVYPIKEKFTLVNELSNDEHFIKDDVFKYFHKAKMKKSNDVFLMDSESKVSVKPSRHRFLGHLIFLINENCASATTSFLGQIRTHRPDALFVGNKTLGNPAIVVADYMVSLNLPNSDIIVKIPLVSSEKNVNFENPKGGVIPDILIPLTIEEAQLKTDNSKRRAYEIINDMKKNGQNKD